MQPTYTWLLEHEYTYTIHNKKLISRWDSERELLTTTSYTYYEIQKRALAWSKYSTYVYTSISCPSKKLSNSVKLRGGWLLRRSRSFKITHFGTNRKLIYDFLLLINSKYLVSCTVYKIWFNFRWREGIASF